MLTRNNTKNNQLKFKMFDTVVFSPLSPAHGHELKPCTWAYEV